MPSKKAQKKKSATAQKPPARKKAGAQKPKAAPIKKTSASTSARARRTLKEAADLLPDPANSPFDTVTAALKDLKKGKMVILVDDEDRENEGDLILPAEFVTPEAIAFMAKKASGLICLAMTEEACDRLHLPLQTTTNSSRFGTAFTVSVEARRGVTTGISAADRALTIKTAIDPKSSPDDLARPGHVFPLRARKGGVLVRAGQTEGSVDLCRMAGLNPAAVICEIMNEDGTMARLSHLELFAAEHGLKIISIADLIEHRRNHEKLIKHAVTSEMPTQHGDFRCHVYQTTVGNEHHVALTMGHIKPGKIQREPVLVRVHSECLTGDAFGSLRCDCGDQLTAAMEMVRAAGRGVVLYMRQEGRGIGLVNKLKAYTLQDHGADTVEANQALGFKPDLRRYGLGAQILYDLGLRKLKLITNNPRKIVGLSSFGLEVVDRVALKMPPRPQNRGYLKAKKEKLGHLLDDM